mmetsp:Transcript_61028/g.125832  ORF Transcript_61028/g.125832 Transcript_61028/m.125832 type:complete len:226 (-) Transcript_61028:1159-1836(-)
MGWSRISHKLSSFLKTVHPDHPGEIALSADPAPMIFTASLSETWNSLLLTYELVRDAPTNLQVAIFTALNAMLDGTPIPEAQKGGLVRLIRNAHTGAWIRVRTPFGETAKIQVSRGTPQGDALSPSLFIFFINLMLRHLSAAGVGFVHKVGVKRNNCTFADDVCLIAENVEDMNKLLLKFDGATMSPLSAHRAFKYSHARRVGQPVQDLLVGSGARHVLPPTGAR